MGCTMYTDGACTGCRQASVVAGVAQMYPNNMWARCAKGVLQAGSGNRQCMEGRLCVHAGACLYGAGAGQVLVVLAVVGSCLLADNNVLHLTVLSLYIS